VQSMKIDTMPADVPSPFQPTRWSLIQRVQGGGAEGAKALAELCEAYWFPLYGWARRSGMAAPDAEDVVQGFFCDVLRKEIFAKADLSKGRLRTLLLTAFRRYRNDQYDKAGAERRGADLTVSFDAAAGEEWYLEAASGGATPDAFYDRQWALTLLEQAMRRLGDEYTKRGKGGDFDRLRRYLTETEDADYDADAVALNVTAGTVRVAVSRMRERFGQALRAEVASLLPENGDVDGELTHLLAALEA
jgi:DNA-directed RNA polymerase specialized sigma24 family protein